MTQERGEGRTGGTREGAVLVKRVPCEERNKHEDERDDQCPRTVEPFIISTHAERRKMRSCMRSKHEQRHDNSPRSLCNGEMPRAGLNDCTHKRRAMSRPSTGLTWKPIPTSSGGWIAETLGVKASSPSWLGVGWGMMPRSCHRDAFMCSPLILLRRPLPGASSAFLIHRSRMWWRMC